jgi:hypothetical protein
MLTINILGKKITCLRPKAHVSEKKGLEKRYMIHKGHFELVNQKDMRSNTQNKTEKNINNFARKRQMEATS